MADTSSALEINKDVSEDDGELSRIVSLMETDDFERIPSLSHVSDIRSMFYSILI
jgi:hypothetical protein